MKRCALTLVAFGTWVWVAAAQDRHYGPGNNAVGNWSSNNWYTAQTGGTLTTAPGLGNRAVITAGDQVTLDQNVLVGSLLVGSGGGSQPTRLSFLNNSFSVAVATQLTLQTTFGSSANLLLNGGSITTTTLRLQAGFGNTSGAGTALLSTSNGAVTVLGNIDVTSGTNVPAGGGQFTMNVGGGGLMTVFGNVVTTNFADPDPSVLWVFDDTATQFGQLTLQGTANFGRSTFIVEVETFTPVVGAYTIVSAGSWAQGFDAYGIRTTSGTNFVALGDTVTQGAYTYSLALDGNNLNLSIVPEPSTLGLLSLAGLLAWRARRRAVLPRA